MKKTILFIFSLLMAVNAFAWKPSGFTIGGGYVLNNNSLSIDQSENPSDLKSFQGYFLQVGQCYNISEHSSIIGSLRFEGLSSGTSSQVTMNRKKHYLEIPLEYQFSFKFNETVRGFLSAGPAFSLWLSYYSVKNGSSEIYYDYIYDNYNRCNCLLTATAGIDIIGIKVFARFSQALLSFTDKEKYYRGASGSFNEVQIGVAYTF